MHARTFNIGKYTPVLQGEQSGQSDQNTIAVQDGENFAWHTRGVFSAHSYEAITGPANVAELHPHDWLISGRRIWTFIDGVYVVDNGAYVPLFEFNLPVAENPFGRELAMYKWTYAYVGCRHHFSHPLVNEIIYYDESLDIWGNYRNDDWNGPIFGITHADNRLVIMLEDVVGWSNFDDGHAWTEGDWYKGSGYQSLALIRYGQPFGVWPFRNGFLSFTQRGIMYSAPILQGTVDPTQAGGREGLTKGPPALGGQLIFRHEELNFDDIPVGPAAIEHIEEKQVIWLSRKGFQSFAPDVNGGEGNAPSTWQTEMSLFYRELVLPERLEEVNTQLDDFALNYSREIGWLFVSSTCEAGEVGYDRAHVYQFELDRWGSFNHRHLHVGYQHANDERDRGFYGFADMQGRYCEVDHQPRNFISWVKFTPVRLADPGAQGIGAEMVSSVQGIRLGVSKPFWRQREYNPREHKAGLYSSWYTDKQDHEHVSNFACIISSGFDSTTYVVDEQEHAQLTNRTDESMLFSCHSTGLAHNLIVSAENENCYYDISHIEISYFFAGVA